MKYFMLMGSLLLIAASSCQKEVKPLRPENAAAKAFAPELLVRVNHYDTTTGTLSRYINYHYNAARKITSISSGYSSFPQADVFHLVYDTNGRLDSVISTSTIWPQTFKYLYDARGRISKTVMHPSWNEPEAMSRDTMYHDPELPPIFGWDPAPTYRVSNGNDYYNYFYAYNSVNDLLEMDIATYYTFRDARYIFHNTTYANPEYPIYRLLRLQDLDAQAATEPPLHRLYAGATVFDQLTYISEGSDEYHFRYEVAQDAKQRVNKVYYLKANGEKILCRSYEYQ